MEQFTLDVPFEHMDKRTESQSVVEEAVNLPENKPDMEDILFFHGQVVTEENKPGTDVVNARGYLCYRVLYRTLEAGGRLVPLEGRIPLEERIYADGITPSNQVTVFANPEDFRIRMVHARKLNVRALLSWRMEAPKRQLVHFPTDVQGEENTKVCKETWNVTEQICEKKETIKIGEEIKLPSEYPNIFQILYYDVLGKDLDCRPGEGACTVSGEYSVWVLYEAENHSMRAFETKVPYEGKVECDEAVSDMQCSLRVISQDIKLQPMTDSDNEERIFRLDVNLSLEIKGYKERKLDVVTDVYSTKNNTECTYQEERINTSRQMAKGIARTAQNITVDAEEKPIQHILCYKGLLVTGKEEQKNEGLLIQAGVLVTVLYTTGEEEKPYKTIEQLIPLDYVLENVGEEGEKDGVSGQLTELSVEKVTEKELSIRVEVCYRKESVWEEKKMILNHIEESKMDAKQRKSMPAIVIYTVAPGDTLWKIGKKYKISTDRIMERNHMTSDEIYPGDRLLISKV